MISEEKKQEIWDHLLSTPEITRPKNLSNKKLLKIKDGVWESDNFWMDICCAHGLLERSPLQLKDLEVEIYNHYIEKSWILMLKMINN